MQDRYASHYMQVLACLIGLTGTDFTRNLPLVGVKKIWGMLAERGMWDGILQSFDMQESTLDPGEAGDRFIARIYLENYSKHVSGVPSSLESVLCALSSCSKLSDRTKTLLPSDERVRVTIRNINWLLKYWMCQQPCRKDSSAEWMDPCPDPVTLNFGFGMNPSRKNAVVWADEL